MTMKIARIFALLALVAVVAVGCKNREKSSKTTQMDKAWKLTIEHIGCRGMCPAYTITVTQDGVVSYQGNRAVEMMGAFTKTIPGDKVKALDLILTEYKFEDFDAVYGGEVADLPSVRTTVTRNGNTKTVENIRNAPEALNKMQERLENMIGPDGYSKAE